MNAARRRGSARRAAERGTSLIELMIGLTVSSLVIVVASTLFINVAAANRSASQVGDLLDVARVALDEMAFDIMHAGYYGKVSGAAQVDGRRGGPGELPAGDLPGNDCGTRWTSDLDVSLVVHDQTTTLACVPGARIDDTDVLAVKRAGAVEANVMTVAGVDDDALHVASDPLKARLFLGASPDLSGFAGTAEIRPLEAHIYYISTASDVPGTAASLRRVTLAAGPTYQDVELVPGVEDLQIECGIDVNGDGSVDAYVAPDAAAGQTVVALRVSLLAHALARDLRYVDQDEYLAQGTADRKVAVENRRRMQFSRTVLLRNPT